MKKIISLLCCLAMAFSLASIPVFAAEESPIVTEANSNSDEDITTYATSQGLWYKENLMYLGIYSLTVTPESGANLRVWFTNDNTVRLTVYKTTALGTYSKIYTKSFSAGTRDVLITSNCNGKKYLVKFQGPEDDMTTSSILVYQN